MPQRLPARPPLVPQRAVGYRAPTMTDFDFSTLSMTEIIRQQNLLQQELTRRFERRMTLVFSDIVGSTPYFARFGDAAGFQLQQRHMDLLNSCLPAREGRIVDTAGDGAFVAFPTADAATNALIEFQQLISRENATRARDHQLQVRIGVHCGPVLTDGEVFSGDAVNLCARVASSASPGEIRLTREVFQDLALTHRLNCRPLGPVDLKGLSRQIELLNLDWRDHSMFPTLFRIEETGEEVLLPQQDIISFGRLREHEGTLANDVVLTLPDPPAGAPDQPLALRVAPACGWLSPASAGGRRHRNRRRADHEGPGGCYQTGLQDLRRPRAYPGVRLAVHGRRGGKLRCHHDRGQAASGESCAVG